MGKPSHNPGAEHEPHFQNLPPVVPLNEASRTAAVANEPAMSSERPMALTDGEVARHSVYNELSIFPHNDDQPSVYVSDWNCEQCGRNLLGLHVDDACPGCDHVSASRPAPLNRPGYASWLARKIDTTRPSTIWATTLGLALFGGPWAVIGALMSANTGILGPILFGPIVEEVMKTP